MTIRTPELPDVRVGQLYQDWDTRYRYGGYLRHGRVVAVPSPDEVAAAGSRAGELQVELETWWVRGGSPEKKRTFAKLRRMRPISNGWKLVDEDHS